MYKREDDGSYVLYGHNTVVEKQMDRDFIRWPNEKRWSPKRSGAALSSFENKHKNQTGVIIGKGPGLDTLRNSDIRHGDVVFCCNDSVHKLVALSVKNTLYSIQLDEQLRDTCRCNHATHFISSWAKDWAPDAVILDTHFNKKLLTAVEAIELAKYMGIDSFRLYGFDAMTTGDTSYADCVGYTPGRNSKRFLAHAAYIISALGDSKYEFGK